MQLLETRWFAPPDAPDGVEFEIRPLTMIEAAAFRKVMARHGESSPQAYEKLFEFGLLDWRGIDGPDGRPARCGAKAAMGLPNRLIDRVAEEIFADSFLSEDQRKNLSSQSRSIGTGASSTADGAGSAGTATSATRRRSRSGRSKA